MIRTRRLAESIFILGCIFALVAWMCEGSIWAPLRQTIMQYRVFGYFQGKSESICNLLVGNAIGAFGFSFGFMVDYFGQKKEVEDELVNTYLYLQRKYFTKIFCEKNAFDFQYDEVDTIMEYLSGKKYLFMNYKPRYLILKAKLSRLLKKRKKTDNKKRRRDAYLHENGYALIASVIGKLFAYFAFIYSYQTSICEIDNSIAICKKRIEELKDLEFECEEYKSHHAILNLLKKGYTNRLISRYPLNTTQCQTFLDKQDLHARVFAINTFLNDNHKSYAASDLSYMLFADDYIVKDEERFFDASDSEIKVMFTIDEVKHEKQRMEQMQQ